MAVLVLGVLPLAWGAAASARETGAVKTVRYRGYSVRVPRSWPVFNLRSDPSACVRFNRHALYLGTPGGSELCPPQEAGRSEAILLEPLAARAASSTGAGTDALPAVTVAGAQRGQASAGELAIPAHGVLATATWSASPGLIERALGIRSVKELHQLAGSGNRGAGFHARAAGVKPAQSSVFTGLGFDACSAPSTSTMSAWGASPYRAIGVYIGGVNMACSQGNLTSGWVAAETDAGWHLIPTYVGVQAPSNSCGCQGIVPSQARAEGVAAATDAVNHARSLGIGSGDPIYFDMESYSKGGTNTSAVLTFLAGWTSRLHSDGYRSGVYSNSDSGISDLVSRWGSGYAEPDDIWMANWNGEQTTSDPYVPSGDWANHQRLHQYLGGHNATYGGRTIDIDSNYLDGATVGAGAGIAGPPPTNTQPPSIFGNPKVGWTLSAARGSWSGIGNTYSYQWQRCTPGCVNIASGHQQKYRLAAADVDASVRVIVSASSGGGSARATSAAVGPVEPTGYWLYSAYGNVYPSRTLWLGAASRRGVRTRSIVGMAATHDGRGYWQAASNGQVYAFGDAPTLPTRNHRVTGIVGDPLGGYWLFSNHGNVYTSSGTGWFGSVPSRHVRTSSIVGMAASADGGGYWLASSSGRVRAFGDAAKLPAIPHARRVLGIVANPRGGYWLFTKSGNVYASAGAGWFGSVASRHVRTSSIVGMGPTTDGKGYWLVSSTGRVYPFGDAARMPAPHHSHPIKGIAAQP